MEDRTVAEWFNYFGKSTSLHKVSVTNFVKWFSTMKVPANSIPTIHLEEWIVAHQQNIVNLVGEYCQSLLQDIVLHKDDKQYLPQFFSRVSELIDTAEYAKRAPGYPLLSDHLSQILLLLRVLAQA